ncbi:MAG: hypothetical protein ACOYL8_04155 [Patescibacteria group bacterium]
MMKLFIVYGLNSNEEKALTPNLLEDIPAEQVCVIRLKGSDPHEALRHVLDALRPYQKDYRQVLVAYSGENLYLLADNLPCRKVDMVELRKNLIKELGPCKTSRDYEVLAETFSAIILRKLDPKPIENHRSYSGK